MSHTTIQTGRSLHDEKQYLWRINGYSMMEGDAAWIKKQSFEIVTETPKPNTTAKWSVGLKIVKVPDGQTPRIRGNLRRQRKSNVKSMVTLCCKLLGITSPNNEVTTVEVEFHAEAIRGDNSVAWSTNLQKSIKIGGELDLKGQHTWPLSLSKDEQYVHCDHQTGAKSFLIKLRVFKDAVIVGDEVPANLDEKFIQKAQTKLKEDMKSLSADAKVNASKEGDLTLICSDGKRLKVHREILRARNQPFLQMLETEVEKNKAGADVVTIKDVKSHTMGLVLNYIYKGELQPNWCDSDVIVDFTYAVGKYKLTELLDYLDKKIGSVVSVRNTRTLKRSGPALADLAQKFGLKNAEAQLKGNIIKGIQETAGAVSEFFHAEKRTKLENDQPEEDSADTDDLYD